MESFEFHFFSHKILLARERSDEDEDKNAKWGEMKKFSFRVVSYTETMIRQRHKQVYIHVFQFHLEKHFLVLFYFAGCVSRQLSCAGSEAEQLFRETD